MYAQNLFRPLRNRDCCDVTHTTNIVCTCDVNQQILLCVRRGRRPRRPVFVKTNLFSHSPYAGFLRVLMRQQNDGGWHGGGCDVPYGIALGLIKQTPRNVLVRIPRDIHPCI